MPRATEAGAGRKSGEGNSSDEQPWARRRCGRRLGRRRALCVHARRAVAGALRSCAAHGTVHKERVQPRGSEDVSEAKKAGESTERAKT